MRESRSSSAGDFELDCSLWRIAYLPAFTFICVSPRCMAECTCVYIAILDAAGKRRGAGVYRIELNARNGCISRGFIGPL